MPVCSDHLSDHSGQSEGVIAGARENAKMRVILAPFYLAVNSSMVQRLHKFAHCIYAHEYAPYAKKRSGDEKVVRRKTILSEEDARKLEEFIPTRTMHLTLLRPHICIYCNDLPPYDVTVTRTVKPKSKNSKVCIDLLVIYYS